MCIVYGKLELKLVYSSRNRNSCCINIIINIFIVYMVIDNVEIITGEITTIVLLFIVY